MQPTWLVAGLGVVLLAIDAARLLILLRVQSTPIRAVEPAIVGGAHGVLFAVHRALLVLKVRSLARGELTGRYAVANALLLIDLALIDGAVRLGRLRESGS